MKRSAISIPLIGLLALAHCGTSDSVDNSGGGGSANAGGNTASGGSGGSSQGSGGSTSSRSTSAQGGAASGGATGSGGKTGAGGSVGSGGATGAGGSSTGTTGAGGASAGGASGTGGHAADAGAGGSSAGHVDGGAGGQTGSSGGGSSAGGSSGTGGSSGGTSGPCDIYQAANTPCVAAHSMVRALFAAYSGALYQVRRASDKTTKDIPVSAAGGFVDVSVQDTFCSGTTCTISTLYDQTSNHNDLVKSPKAYWLDNGGTEANAADGKTTVSGHTVHGIAVTGYASNPIAYRNNSTKGVVKDNGDEAMYMVVDGKRYSNQCCFDYGNAETTGNDEGNGTMEAVYWGSDTTWGGTGSGSGPWVAADLENGVFKSNQGGWKTTANTPGAKSIVATFATAMLKGPSTNKFTLKGGDAQSGTLTTMWDGSRPSASGYSPKKLQGAIILGTGGDGSDGGTGTFYEGAMTSGNPSDATDDAIQANIVAAKFGK